MKLIGAVNWDEVKETAKFYYTDETTTLNLYPALIISILLLFLLVPILGAIPTIDLFPSTSGGNHTLNIYDKVGCHRYVTSRHPLSLLSFFYNNMSMAWPHL